MISTWSTLPKTDCNSYGTRVYYNSSSPSLPNHNCSGEQSHVQVLLYAFIARNQFPVACTCSLIILRRQSFPSGLPFKGTNCSGGAFRIL